MINANFLNQKNDYLIENNTLSLKSKDRFFNRELSWISFNWRVLKNSENINIPILERVRFLAISASNLDEFYTVRVAGLRAMVKENISTPSADGLTPSKQLANIEKEARNLIEYQQNVWQKLNKELKLNGFCIFFMF